MTANPDEELDRLLGRFVKVRLVQMGGVDLSVFQFDPLQTWALFFMNADQTIYGRFGSASPKAKRNQKDSNPNHSVAGLKAALRKSLELHASYTKNPEAEGLKLAGKTGPKPEWATIESLPAAKKRGRIRRIAKADPKQCAHCHELAQGTVDSYLMTKQRIPDRELWAYPSPSILGLTMSRDHCARVVAVAKDSIAAKAGVEPGEDILVFSGQPPVSVADIQFALHQFPDEGGSLWISSGRGGRVQLRTMVLPDGWRRQGDWAWRYRVAGYAMWLWAGFTMADHEKGVRVAGPPGFWFKKSNPSGKAVFEKGDVIVEADGRAGWTRSTFLAYLMRDKELGSEVKVKVLRGGETVELEFTIPNTQPEVLGH